MKVKTRITFEVEYPLTLEFYETNDEEKALEMERACVVGDPVGIISTSTFLIPPNLIIVPSPNLSWRSFII